MFPKLSLSIWWLLPQNILVKGVERGGYKYTQGDTSQSTDIYRFPKGFSSHTSTDEVLD